MYCLKTLFLTVLAFINFIARSQPEQTAYRSFKVDDNEASEEVVPAETDGLYLVEYFSRFKSHHIEITHLDTTLSVNWKGSIDLEDDGQIIGSEYFGGSVYLLFNHANSRKVGLEIIRISSNESRVTRYPVYNLIPLHVTEFHITSRAALLCGYYADVPVGIYFDFATLKSRVLPGLFSLPGNLNQVAVYPDGSFDLVIASRDYERHHVIWLKSFDGDGNLSRNVALHAPEKTSMIFGRTIRSANNDQVITGVYGSRGANYSSGIFLSSISPSGEYSTQYHGFGDLDHFFDFMKPRHETRVKRRIARRDEKGKITRFNYKMFVDNIFSFKNRTLLLGEVFYPRYRTTDVYNSLYFPGGLGPDYYHSSVIFDGYEYSHAILLYFDPSGRRISDYTLDIEGVRSYVLSQVVQLDIQGDRLALFYLAKDQLHSTIIENQRTSDTRVEKLHLSGELAPPEHHNGRQTDLRPWYDHAYFVTGTTLASGMLGGREFFISKIICR